MAAINTNGEFVDVQEVLGITFTVGNIYTFQAEQLCYLKQGDYEETTINFITPISWTANSDGLKVMTPIGTTCVFKLIAMSEG